MQWVFHTSFEFFIYWKDWISNAVPLPVLQLRVVLGYATGMLVVLMICTRRALVDEMPLPLPDT